MAVKKSKQSKKAHQKAKKPAIKAKVKPVKKAAKSAKPAKKSLPKPKSKAKPVSKAKVKAASPAKSTAKKTNSNKPIIRTGPSIAPRNFGKLPLAILARGPVKKLKPEKAKPLTKKDLEFHRDLLLKLRDRVIDEISFLANDNLNRSAKESSGDLSSYSFHMADQGTDNFDREFAASLLNNEHDVLYEIEEALRRIDQGTYGVCEMSGKPIERERLKVLPFARYCVSVQSEMERGKPRFRPFRRTSIQSTESAV